VNARRERVPGEYAISDWARQLKFAYCLIFAHKSASINYKSIA
jgi:hypothetical protein